MPECATEDAARYPLSVYTPKLRATGAANAFEVSQLLRTAQRGMEAGIDSCKNFGPMTGTRPLMENGYLGITGRSFDCGKRCTDIRMQEHYGKAIVTDS